MALFSFTPHNLIAIHSLAEGIFFYGLGAASVALSEPLLLSWIT